MLSNMAASLILHKRINTTVAKAKALRGYVEPLITKAKDNTTHSRRVVFSYLQDKTAVTELFREVSAKVGDRPGGYTRIIKLGNRLGDNADMAMIELVDFNELLVSEKSAKKAKTARRRRGAKKPAAAATADVEVKEEVTEAKEEVTDVKEEVVETKEEVAEVKEEKPATEPKAEVKKEKEEKKEVKKEEEPKKEEPKKPEAKKKETKKDSDEKADEGKEKEDK
jgi:large subunit ribosomal protein L17